MTGASEPIGRLGSTHFPIERAAASLVAHRTNHSALVVVVRPQQIDATVIAHDDHIGLRAAVRVAATAGNTRAWRSLGPWIERVDVSSLPAVINLAAKRDRVRSCHMGGVFVGDRMAAVALWFSRRERDTAAAQAYRNDTFAMLRVAATPEVEPVITGTPRARHGVVSTGSTTRPAALGAATLGSDPTPRHEDLSVGEPRSPRTRGV